MASLPQHDFTSAIPHADDPIPTNQGRFAKEPKTLEKSPWISRGSPEDAHPTSWPPTAYYSAMTSAFSEPFPDPLQPTHAPRDSRFGDLPTDLFSTRETNRQTEPTRFTPFFEVPLDYGTIPHDGNRPTNSTSSSQFVHGLQDRDKTKEPESRPSSRRSKRVRSSSSSSSTLDTPSHKRSRTVTGGQKTAECPDTNASITNLIKNSREMIRLTVHDSGDKSEFYVHNRLIEGYAPSVASRLSHESTKTYVFEGMGAADLGLYVEWLYTTRYEDFIDREELWLANDDGLHITLLYDAAWEAGDATLQDELVMHFCMEASDRGWNVEWTTLRRIFEWNDPASALYRLALDVLVRCSPARDNERSIGLFADVENLEGLTRALVRAKAEPDKDLLNSIDEYRVGSGLGLGVCALQR